MKVKVKDLQKMLDDVVKKTGHTKDHAGLVTAGEKIGCQGGYLYKNIFQKIKKLNDDETLNLRDGLLNEIALALGHRSFKEYKDFLNTPVDALLSKSAGIYYSYVRRNTNVGAVLRSPVRISVENGKVSFELKGKSLSYRGNARIAQGCLFIYMLAENGKAFYHVYKIGASEKPQVLQGTFSGVSTSFDPISGRAVLIRTEEDFDSMTNAELFVSDINKSKSLIERRLAEYFQHQQGNNLSINKVITYRLDDLGECE